MSTVGKQCKRKQTKGTQIRARMPCSAAACCPLFLCRSQNIHNEMLLFKRWSCVSIARTLKSGATRQLGSRQSVVGGVGMSASRQNGLQGDSYPSAVDVLGNSHVRYKTGICSVESLYLLRTPMSRGLPLLQEKEEDIRGSLTFETPGQMYPPNLVFSLEQKTVFRLHRRDILTLRPSPLG